MKKILIILTFILLAAQKPISPWEIDGLTGKKAPEFTLKDINGRNVSIASLRGKVVLINFWATWCPPCRAEMPSMNRLYREYKGKGLEILAISTDNSASKVKDYISQNSLAFQVLMDDNIKVARQYKVFSLPTTFLIDRNGIIVDRFLGEQDWISPEQKKRIEELLH